MSSGGGAVDYTLFRRRGPNPDLGHTVGTDTVSGTGSGASQSSYGLRPGAAQATPAVLRPGAAPSDLAAATYTDTVTVTVTY